MTNGDWKIRPGNPRHDILTRMVETKSHYFLFEIFHFDLTILVVGINGNRKYPSIPHSVPMNSERSNKELVREIPTYHWKHTCIDMFIIPILLWT